MGMNNLLYQYQNTNEFVCSDGRMSVNGICQVPQPNVVEQPVVEQINNNLTGDQGEDKNFFTEKADFSKTVKSNFEWDLDKIGNKVGNINTTIKGNIAAYDEYIEENFGIPKGVSYGARAVGVGMGVSTYGMAGALLPFTIPFIAGGALNNSEKKKQQYITDQNKMRDEVAVIQSGIDTSTYDIPTYGQPGFNPHNDAGDNNNGIGSSRGGGPSPGSTGLGGSDAMGSS